MCLTKIFKVLAYSAEVKTGYKAVYPGSVKPDSIQCLYRVEILKSAVDGRIVYDFLCLPRGEWLEAREREVYSAIHNTAYTSGFHLYPTLEEACNGMSSTPAAAAEFILEVKYRGRITLGEECGIPVVVASELYIPKEGEQC